MSDPEATAARPDAPVAFFRERFGVDDARLEPRARRRARAPRRRTRTSSSSTRAQDSVALEEGIVKSGERHVEQGVGVRVADRRAPGLRALRRDHASRACELAADDGARDLRAARRQRAGRGARAARRRATSTRSRRAPTDVPDRRARSRCSARSTPTRAAATRASSR